MRALNSVMKFKSVLKKQKLLSVIRLAHISPSGNPNLYAAFKHVLRSNH